MVEVDELPTRLSFSLSGSAWTRSLSGMSVVPFPVKVLSVMPFPLHSG